MGCLQSSAKLSSQGTKLIRTASRADNESIGKRIIKHARSIKTTVNLMNDFNSSDAATNDRFESKISSDFKDIMFVAQRGSDFEGDVLNEVLVACNMLRLSNSAVAIKLAYLSNCAKKLVEERTSVTEDMESEPGSSQKGSPEEMKAQNQLTEKISVAPAILVSQTPRDTQGKMISSPLVQLTDSGLPPLKNFPSQKDDFHNSSTHSTDFGFFDLSMHDVPTNDATRAIIEVSQAAIAKKAIKLQYSASQLNMKDIA